MRRFYTPLHSNKILGLIKSCIKKKYENIRLWCVLGDLFFEKYISILSALFSLILFYIHLKVKRHLSWSLVKKKWNQNQNLQVSWSIRTTYMVSSCCQHVRASLAGKISHPGPTGEEQIRSWRWFLHTRKPAGAWTFLPQREALFTKVLIWPHPVFLISSLTFLSHVPHISVSS